MPLNTFRWWKPANVPQPTNALFAVDVVLNQASIEWTAFAVGSPTPVARSATSPAPSVEVTAVFGSPTSAPDTPLVTPVDEYVAWQRVHRRVGGDGARSLPEAVVEGRCVGDDFIGVPATTPGALGALSAPRQPPCAGCTLQRHVPGGTLASTQLSAATTPAQLAPMLCSAIVVES